MRFVTGTVAFCLLAGIAAAQEGSHGQLALTLENDVTSTTDRNYTSGVRLGFLSNPIREDGPLGTLDAWLDRQTGPGVLRWGIGLQQQIYTPANLDTARPDPADRPYAGVLAGTLNLVRTRAETESRVTAEFGVIGPAALGEQVQNGVHRLIDKRQAQGWGYQLPNRADIGLVLDHRWRIDTGQVLGLGTQVIPAVGGSLGTVQSWLGAGVMVRIGSAAGLAADFGPQRIPPGLSAALPLAPPEQFAWYAFLGVQGRLVPVDLTLQGYDGRGVSKRNQIGEAEAGLVFFWKGVRLTLMQVVRSAEFAGQGALAGQYRRQRGGPVSFGSLTLTIPF